MVDTSFEKSWIGICNNKKIWSIEQALVKIWLKIYILKQIKRPIFHFLRGPVRDPVGPDGFLEKRARTKKAFFGTCSPKHNPEGDQMVIGSIKSTLQKNSKSVVFYR